MALSSTDHDRDGRAAKDAMLNRKASTESKNDVTN